MSYHKAAVAPSLNQQQVTFLHFVVVVVVVVVVVIVVFEVHLQANSNKLFLVYSKLVGSSATSPTPMQPTLRKSMWRRHCSRAHHLLAPLRCHGRHRQDGSLAAAARSFPPCLVPVVPQQRDQPVIYGAMNTTYEKEYEILGNSLTGQTTQENSS